MEFNSFDILRSQDLMERTKQAYSRGLYYSEKSWREIILWLMDCGHDAKYIKELMHHKHMRWAAVEFDEGTDPNDAQVPSKCFFKYYEKYSRLHPVEPKSTLIDID